jgi:hypothetical protein
MEVTLDRTDGVAFAFHLSVNGATLRGEDFGRKISITICQKTPWKFLELETSPKDVKQHEARSTSTSRQTTVTPKLRRSHCVTNWTKQPSPLPGGWKAEEMAAVALSTDKRNVGDFNVDGNQIKVAAKAQQPVMVYRKKEAARLG